MSQTRLVRGRATLVFQDGQDTVVQYHDTEVVRFSKNRIVLDSGGWRTSTTKARMNQAANQYDLPFQVFQKRHEWFVTTTLGDRLFEDGMVIPNQHTNTRS